MFNVFRMGMTVAFAALGSLALTAASSAGQTFTVVERASTDAVTDTGDKGDTAGDILTFANEIFDEANTNSVGTDNGWCVRTVPGKAWECFWTANFKDGQITVEGPFLDAGDLVLAITGGTGAYAGARGEMKLHPRDDKGSEYDFSYSLQ